MNHKLSAVLFFREEINGNIPVQESHADRPQPEKARLRLSRHSPYADTHPNSLRRTWKTALLRLPGGVSAQGSHADRPQPEKRGCGCRGIRRMHNQARIATGELEKQLSCGDPGLVMRMARYFAQDYARNDRFCYWFFRIEEVYWTQQDRQNAWRNRADGPER